MSSRNTQFASSAVLFQGYSLKVVSPIPDFDSSEPIGRFLVSSKTLPNPHNLEMKYNL